MKEQEKVEPTFQVICISCGGKIRENASDASYGMCLRCFYTLLAVRLRNRTRTTTGEFVSER